MIEWISAKKALPPVGVRVLATDGQVVGEAYITVVGSVMAWHRSFNMIWECWSRNQPVIAWAKMPTYDGGTNE